MSELKDRLQTELTAAMRARDEVRLATLRMTLTMIKTEEVSGGTVSELDDAGVLKVLAREAKKRRESAEAFDAGGRPELATRERAEGAILEEYLPAQISDDDLRTIVAHAVAESGATSPQQMGAVMKLVSPQVAGRAEGGRVAAEVKKQLAPG